MRRQRWYERAVASVMVTAVGVLVMAGVSAQTPPAGAAAERETVARGEAWFYQRCSLCHMGRIVKDDTYQPMAVPLAGVLKDATPEREQFVRAYIQQGTARMPGFRYNLTPAEFEELIAYLKTL